MVVRTDYELIIEKILDENKFPFYYTDSVFCFSCYRYFEHNNRTDYCRLCYKKFSDKNEMALPDFIIDTNPNKFTKKTRFTPEEKEKYLRNITIVKIDGEVHDKRRQMYTDYYQFEKFRSRGVRVVIIRNENIKRKDKKNHQELFEKIERLSEYEKLQAYDEYLKSKEFEENFKVPVEFIYRRSRT